jgi:hypothetical protein
MGVIWGQNKKLEELGGGPYEGRKQIVDNYLLGFFGE